MKGSVWQTPYRTKDFVSFVPQKIKKRKTTATSPYQRPVKRVIDRLAGSLMRQLPSEIFLVKGNCGWLKKFQATAKVYQFERWWVANALQDKGFCFFCPSKDKKEKTQ